MRATFSASLCVVGVCAGGRSRQIIEGARGSIMLADEVVVLNDDDEEEQEEEEDKEERKLYWQDGCCLMLELVI